MEKTEIEKNIRKENKKSGELKKIKQVSKNKKKKKIWLIKAPKKLDREIKDFVNKYDISLSNFVRKSVYYLTKDEVPELTKNKSVNWLIQVHSDLDQ